ncbi:MAG: hypothetical protein Q7Q71_14650 [Verrucomicrobiota bacterium JB023]|nr:hypothetical protein [Verrucomicrobiota bacterium JB023]
MIKSLFVSLLLLGLLPAEEPTDFIQVDEDEGRARLQTSITTYEKEDLAITLIGAVHIGDEGYYQKLNETFRDYEVVLFELIGGEKAAQFLNGQGQPEKPVDGRPAEGLRDIYGSFARSMQLSEQVHHIDYTADNFVHADLTLAEYDDVMDGKEDEILAFAFEANAKNSEITGDAFGGVDMGLLMRAILSGDSSGLKLQMMKNMDTGDEAAAAIAGDNIIIGERNEKCFLILDEQIKAGKTNIGIFYGAAHFPEMEERLLTRGFEKTTHRWLTAWDVEKPE